METKSGTMTIKQVSEGKVVATLAQLGVIDKDGDVLAQGLVNGRQIVAIKPQHKWDHVNLGVAEVYEVNGTMEASLEYNLAIPSAKDWFESTRFSHERNHHFQYSFGFEVLDSERGVHEGKGVRFLKEIAIAECSPVLIGASVGSRTLSVKEANDLMIEPPPLIVTHPDDATIEAKRTSRLIHPHHTAIDEHTWDAVMMYRQIKDTMTPAYYRNLYAWQDPHGPERSKGSYRFLHHVVSKRGDAGAASVRACAQILEWLHSGQATASTEELQAIYAHVAAHLKDAGRDVPELRLDEPMRYPLDDQLELLLWKQDHVLQQIDQVRDMRARKGMTLSANRLQQLDTMKQRFDALCMLVSLKSLDHPADAVLEQLSAEAKAEALGRRIEAMQTRAKAEVDDANAAAAAAAFERFQALQERIRAS